MHAMLDAMNRTPSHIARLSVIQPPAWLPAAGAFSVGYRSDDAPACGVSAILHTDILHDRDGFSALATCSGKDARGCRLCAG